MPVPELSSLIIALVSLLGMIYTLIKGGGERKNILKQIEQAEINAVASATKIIADLQAQLGTATEAGGKLRDELQRMHKQDEEQEEKIIELTKTNTSYAETIASLSETNAKLLVKEQQARAGMATWQKKYLEAVTEKDALTELVGSLKAKLEKLETEFSKVKLDTGKLFQVTQGLRK